MPSGTRRAVYVLSLILVAVGAGCGGVLKPQYEYEEELYIALDGSATLNLNASVASLVALRGVDLPTDPRARLDRQRVRALFEAPGARVAVSLSRRDGRRFVHVRVDVEHVRHLARIMPFSWSTYKFQRRENVVEYRQVVGAAAAKRLTDVGWDGSERVTFRMHVPSEIVFHNSSEDTQRGNILEWQQALADRLKGEPVDLQVHMATESILYTTLLLFGSTILAAAATFALVLWWFARRGREVEMAESHP
jgi:hypothetical protein